MLLNTLQLMIVLTSTWDASQGKLYLFERQNTETHWEQVGKTIPVFVGDRGMGWGRGVHPKKFFVGPVKQEGDKKAPAGIFPLGPVFGYAPDLPDIKMPYLPIDNELECVDDSASSYYNCFVKPSIVEKDWDSSEKMLRDDILYRYGLVIQHNTNPVLPGHGSCIFMHLWRENSEGTAGCTAMAEDELLKIIYWLDEQKYPHIVQLPHAQYVSLKESWQLPDVRD